ncbi:MAG: ATP-grasp domain-containing protein [Eubacterium sp.]|uniref:ATP-grasp domain-containing protein n=1 Tax=Eubacterium sp. TaxID=142586 RepID=UPI0039A300FD
MKYEISQLELLLEKYRKQIDEFIIVCNKKDKTVIKDNYKGSSIETEFLSEDEFNQLFEMAYSLNIPFDVFTSELDFMKTIIDKIDEIKNKRIIVYNSAQNGTGAGRKSLIPAFCNLLGLKHTGSDAYRVSLCRDKFAINSILKSNNIKVPNSFLCDVNSVSNLILPQGKYLIKPLYESASIGIKNKNIFTSEHIPINYIKSLCIELNQSMLIQEFINGYEFEIPILRKDEDILIFDPVILSLESNTLYMGDNILDYDKIYNDNYIFSNMPKELLIYEKPLKLTAYNVAKLLELNGLCRVDGRITKDGDYFITDVSTNPHFIKHSSVNYAFHNNNYTDSDIFKAILLLC